MPDLERTLPPDIVLDRHWDAVLHGASDSLLNETDPGLAATVQRVHALDILTEPRPVFAARLWEDLMAAHTMTAPSGAAPTMLPVPVVAREVSRGRLRATPGPVQHIAAAIVLLALFGVSLVAALAPHWPRRDSRMPLVAPAAEQTTEAPGVVSETLVDLSLSEAAAFESWVSIDPYLYPSGSGSRESSGDAPYVFLVRDGRLTLRLAGRTDEVQIVRPGMNGKLAGDGLLSAGADIPLEAGTSVAIPAATEFELVNSGEAPAILFSLLGGSGHDVDSWGGVSYDSSVSSGGNRRQLAAQTTLILELVTLAPDATLLAPASGSVREAAALQPERIIDLRLGSDRSLRNAGDAPLQTYVLTVTGATPPATAQDDGASQTAAIPEQEVSNTTLLDLTIPAMSPGRAWVQSDRYTLPPGTALPTGTRNAPTVDVYYVVEGALDVNASEAPQPVEIVRSGGQSEVIASGETAEVRAGDAVMVPGGSEASFGNTASTPATMLRLIQPSAAQMTFDLTISVETIGGGNIHDLSSPLRLTLQHATLAPDSSLLLTTSPNLKHVVAALDPDRVTDMRVGSGGSVRNAGDAPLEIYVVTVTHPAVATPASGTT